MARQLVVLQSSLDIFIVPELLYLGQALEHNWEKFAEKMQKAHKKSKNPLVDSDLRALQDAFVLLRSKQGAFTFTSAEEARDYTRNLYALMTKAECHLPPEITSGKVDHYLANAQEAKAKGTLTLDGVDAYQNRLQRWAPALWVSFVALTVAGAGGAALSLGLLAGGWPIALVVVAVVCWALLTFREKWDGSLSRTETFADMLARNTSGLYDGMKKPSLANLGPSLFLVGVLALAVFAPMIGMIASGLAAFGLVAFMVLSVVANGFHNNASLFNAGRKFMEKYLPWFQFGYSKLKEEALPDLEKIQALQPQNHIQFMANHGKLIATATDRKKVIHGFEIDKAIPAGEFKDLLNHKKPYTIAALESKEGRQDARFIFSEKRDDITVKQYMSLRSPTLH
jgi:hypothetical protein